MVYTWILVYLFETTFISLARLCKQIKINAKKNNIKRLEIANR